MLSGKGMYPTGGGASATLLVVGRRRLDVDVRNDPEALGITALVWSGTASSKFGAQARDALIPITSSHCFPFHMPHGPVWFLLLAPQSQVRVNCRQPRKQARSTSPDASLPVNFRSAHSDPLPIRVTAISFYPRYFSRSPPERGAE